MADILGYVGIYLFFMLVVEIFLLFAKHAKNEWHRPAIRGFLCMVVAGSCAEYFFKQLHREEFELSQRLLYFFASAVAYIIFVGFAVFPFEARKKAIVLMVSATIINLELNVIGRAIKNLVEIDSGWLGMILLGIQFGVMYFLSRIFKLEVRPEFRVEKEKNDKKKKVVSD
jgi:hypothetical protein